ncbi:MAG: hypothetical protein HQ553_02810 [Chloroflexi bacterium]|nr:hypothetical protein [Chloroflexota bacterium]
MKLLKTFNAQKYLVLNFLIIVVMVTTIMMTGCGSDDEENTLEESQISSEISQVEEIIIDYDLRLRDGFDYSTYYGTIRSQKELNQLWSQMINIQKEYYHKSNAKVPELPQIDFSKNSVLWFADRGVNASFVSLPRVKEDNMAQALIATVYAFYSDYGSSHLNLWKIPPTEKEIVFEIVRDYEQGGLRRF